jgi:hypothetical protein
VKFEFFKISPFGLQSRVALADKRRTGADFRDIYDAAIRQLKLFTY